jgi:hypothetical protein
VTGLFSITGCTFITQTALVFKSAGLDNHTSAGTIANNIFGAFNGAGLMNISNVTSRDFRGNCYYTYGTPFSIIWNGTTYTSFASWQAATSQEKIVGVNVGITSNPQIYVPGGGWANGGYVPANLKAYNLQAGSLIGGGLDLNALFGIAPGSTDYFG